MQFSFLLFLAILLLIFDLYIYRVLKTVLRNKSKKMRMAVLVAHGVVSVACLAALCFFPVIPFENFHPEFKPYLLALLVVFFFSKLAACIFFLADDIRRMLAFIIKKINKKKQPLGGEPISRSAFLSWLGIGVGSSVFGTFTYGFTNKYNYQVRNVELNFENLPKAFSGLKIVQISDIHVGSFHDKAAVAAGIDQILALKPDIILFTGDLVNDHAEEMYDYIQLFKKLQAPLGVFSILGNHDYGLYAIPRSYSEEQRNERIKINMAKLVELHKDLGWNLLMNEHVMLHRNGESIALLGVENWGAKGNFPQFGKMEEAVAGTDAAPFKILLSHDPSHWDAEILTRYKNIDLTLSGHTHGMQFGVETPAFKWSPVQYMYERWAGLYTVGKQQLYINRGFGFIGYPGRVGILPEITEITLV